MYPWVSIAPAEESPLPKPTTLFYPAGGGQDCGDAGTIGAMSAEICGLFEIDTLTTVVILSLSCEESNFFRAKPFAGKMDEMPDSNAEPGLRQRPSFENLMVAMRFHLQRRNPA